MQDQTNRFLIFGRVFDPEDNRGLAGLTVEALDKDLLLDDRLGATVTDAEGRFMIRYDRADFQELFLDEKPDIYLQVKNQQGTIVYTSVDKIRHEAAAVEEYSIALAKSIAEYGLIEHTRQNFKQLIAINPNYFGTAAKATSTGALASNAVVNLSQNTKYEELRCVGLNPAEDLLEAIIEVKLPYGFNTSLCGAGSKEYVAFFIDYGDGAGWVSAGAPTQVTVHDLVAVNQHHVFYAVRRAFVPQQILACSKPQILKVRAILSWESIPSGPGYVPVWGNVKDVWVQLRPKRRPIVLSPIVLDLPKLDMIQPIPNPIPIPIPDPQPEFTLSGNLETLRETIELTTRAIEQEKQSGQVESQRLEFAELMARNPNYFGSISTATDASEFSADIAKLSPQAVQYLTSKYTIDPKILQAIFPQNPKTKYEELTCVGLYPEEDLLEATIAIKLPYGFNGDLCTLGSWEYVAFYIDWGSGWEYVDTARLQVHNLDTAERVLHYAVKAQLKNVDDRLKLCNAENVVKVRAILSWNYDPTLYGPYYSPAWGNTLERYVQIRPKTGTSAFCSLEIVNEVHIDEISQSGADRGLAYDPLDTVPPLTYNRPFGGTIAAWGNVNIAGAVYYRFRFSADNGVSWSNVLDPRTARNPIFWFPVIQRSPDGAGWFSIADYNTDRANYSLTPLVNWASYGKNGAYLLRLELADATKTPIVGQVVDVALQLDNTDVDFYTFRNTPISLPASGVVVKDTMGHFKKCDSFTGTSLIKVYGNFRDEYFRSFSVTVAGGNISGEYPIASGDFRTPIPGVLNAQGIIGAANNGDGQEIASFNLCAVPQAPAKVKCAYVVVLRVWDRAIVGYLSGYEFNTTTHGRTGYVTFDWDPAGEC